MHYHVMKFLRGGWAPTQLEAIIEGDHFVALRAVDISGGEYYPYTWKLSDFDVSFLKGEVLKDWLSGRNP